MLAAIEISEHVAYFMVATAIFGWVLSRVADLRGWTKSGQIVRQENSDLRQRNAHLEGDIKELRAQVAGLEKQVEDLKSRSVDALFTSFREHDKRMSEAAVHIFDSHKQLTEEISLHEDRSQARHEATVKVLERITAAVDRIAN